MTTGRRIFYIRTTEIILLRRALRIYANTYQQLAAKSTPQWEKDDLKAMVKAADVLAERLLRETLPEDGADGKRATQIGSGRAEPPANQGGNGDSK